MARFVPWLVVVLCMAPLSLPATAQSATGLVFSYEIRARDARIGQARVTVGPREKRGRKSLRQVRIEGSPEDLVGVLYAGQTVAATWVDVDWMPVRAEWRSDYARRKSLARASYGPRRVEATFDRPGRVQVRLDERLEERPHDLVSFIPWLMQRKPRAGDRLAGPVYTGMDVCLVAAVARPVERLLVPLGARAALPVDVTFSKCRIKRGFTVWLDHRDFTPHRLVVQDPLLGAVDVLLLGTAPGVVEGAAAGPTAVGAPRDVR